MKATMKAVAKTTPTASLADEYRNASHDPLMVRCVMLLKSSGITNTAISRRCGVSQQCLRNWQKGKTRRPQATTLRFVLRSIGYELTIKRS